MSNNFGIPEKDLDEIRNRDSNCVYCGKPMIYPCVGKMRKNWATIEHLNFNGPFYWKDGLDLKDIVICCGSCNSSRGNKTLQEWFTSEYCRTRNINETSVATPVKEYLSRNSN